MLGTGQGVDNLGSGIAGRPQVFRSLGLSLAGQARIVGGDARGPTAGAGAALDLGVRSLFAFIGVNWRFFLIGFCCGAFQGANLIWAETQGGARLTRSALSTLRSSTGYGGRGLELFAPLGRPISVFRVQISAFDFQLSAFSEERLDLAMQRLELFGQDCVVGFLAQQDQDLAQRVVHQAGDVLRGPRGVSWKPV